MQDILIVVDMQNDFIDGALGTPEAVAILPHVEEKIKAFKGRVIFTRDTHTPDYMNTQEGKNLPVPHCIQGSEGWQICPALAPYCTEVIDKPTFGSARLGQLLAEANEKDPISSITLIGLCTDICVISNAMLLKAFMPEAPVSVDSRCCAGVTPATHEAALTTMACCQIDVL